jgi:hypothetical protein
MSRVSIARFIAVAIASSCTHGTPSGFTGGSGDSWSLPLVGALDDGVLITTVSIGNRGPYLFAIDPDSAISNIDAELVKAHKLEMYKGPTREGESSNVDVRVLAHTYGLEIGALVVDRLDMMVVPPRTFDVAGRRVHGVLGRDVVRSTLVFGFDRDQSLAHLVIRDDFKPPSDATAIRFEALRTTAPGGAHRSPAFAQKRVSIGSTPRNIVAAQIGDVPFKLHLDLGAATSQLRETLWERAKLTAREVNGMVVDEAGGVRPITKVSEPIRASAGGLTVEGVTFLPYDDRRWRPEDVDGVLGLDFMRGFTVWVDWDAGAMYFVKRREGSGATRIRRWDSPLLNGCKQPGCAGVRVIDPLNGAAPPEGKPHPGLVLSITREERAGGTPLEVTLEAQGKPELPRLVVNMPPNADKVLHQLEPRFLGATLVVVVPAQVPRSRRLRRSTGALNSQCNSTTAT